MKRLIVALAVGGALFAVVGFAAATIPNYSAGNLSQATDAVGNCAGGNLVALDWNTGGSNPVEVTSVDVDAPNACDGATATVEVFDSAAGFEGAGSCTLGASGNCNIDLPDRDVDLVDSARLTLAGP